MNPVSTPIRRHRVRRWLFAAVAPAALFALVTGAVVSRRESHTRLIAEASAAEATLPRVAVTTAIGSDGGRDLTLPGSLAPKEEALVDARATGYVLAWRADIGDRVSAGYVLAELDVPELNQELGQARATVEQKAGALEQATASRDFAKVSAARDDALLANTLSTQQSNDQAHAQAKVAEANVHAAQADLAAARANVRRLEQLTSFGLVVAPFDGRITRRNVDVGSFVAAGGTAGAQPLFEIESDDPIRVTVKVPQAYALSVTAGESASVAVRELPGGPREGKVTRTAGAIDAASRTLDVQIEIPNPRGDLLPGMFGEVTFHVAAAHPVVRVPSSAIIADSHGNHVAVVDPGGAVHLVAVTRGIDDGRQTDIDEGLGGGERIIVAPGAGITDAMRVDPVSS